MGRFALPTAVDGCLFAALNSRKKKSEEFAEKIYWHPTLFFPSLKQSAFWPLFWFRSKNAISHVATSWEKNELKEATKESWVMILSSFGMSNE